MNIKFWIGLSSVEQLDSTFIQRLYNYFGNIEHAFNASKTDLENIEGLSVKKAETFLKIRDSLNLEKLYENVENRGINVITFDSPNYPYMLSQIPNPPIVLYYKGNLSECNLNRTVAFVGSRKASSNGKDSVRKIINEFIGTDICVVSGLAEGIDTVSHRSAIENGIKTIGVIASGFDYKYPAVNKDLYEKIEHGCGALITEYYPTFEPIKFRFPQRNRIVTGISYGTVVGEAAIKSGALISANLTLEQGRELMCIPGSINSKNTEGIYKLLKNGASLVTSAEDILNVLNWEIKKSVPDKRKKVSENQNYEVIINSLSIESKAFDEILSETKLGADELLNLLTIMEVEGLIEQTEGDRYKKI